MKTERLGIAARRRKPGALRRAITLVVGLLALFAQVVPTPVSAAQTWTVNLYTWRAFLYQDPYATACTAATTMIMLNTIAYRHAGGAGFNWTPYRVKNNTANRYDYRDMTSILWFERAHDTLSAFGAGSDAHGWRNALNYYGWGSKAMTDPASAVYDDLEYGSYDMAVHAAVRAIAEFGMPVGIISWAGRHAQVMTGYVVDGEDPATSDAFTVRDIYLSDPLYNDGYVNTMVSNASLKAGALHLRFQSYRQTDSPYDDPYQPGWKRSSVAAIHGSSEWYQRWVIIAPIRAGLPDANPTPTPTPTPSPIPTPSPNPSATPDPTPSVTPTATPTIAPTAPPTVAPSPSAAASTAPSPSTGPSTAP